MSDVVETPEVDVASILRDAITNAFQPIADHVNGERDSQEALQARHRQEEAALEQGQRAARADFIQSLVAGTVLS